MSDFVKLDVIINVIKHINEQSEYTRITVWFLSMIFVFNYLSQETDYCWLLINGQNAALKIKCVLMYLLA